MYCIFSLSSIVSSSRQTLLFNHSGNNPIQPLVVQIYSSWPAKQNTHKLLPPHHQRDAGKSIASSVSNVSGPARTCSLYLCRCCSMCARKRPHRARQPLFLHRYSRLHSGAQKMQKARRRAFYQRHQQTQRVSQRAWVGSVTDWQAVNKISMRFKRSKNFILRFVVKKVWSFLGEDT